MAKHTFAWNITLGRFLVLAIVAAALALVTFLSGYTVYTPYIVVGAVMATVMAFATQYASTGNIPGTPIPYTSLIVWGIVALIAFLGYLLNHPDWDTPTIVAGIIIFLTTLLHEIQSGQNPPAPTPAT